MTEYQRQLEISRLTPKLRLWDTPGFFHFIKDLSEYLGPEIHLGIGIEALKKTYLQRMKELTNNPKQGELPL